MSRTVATGKETKRQNFNVTPEQEAEISWLREAIDAPTTKDAILRAVRVMATLAKEAQGGYSIYVGTATGTPGRLLIPELESVMPPPLKYLVARPHAWRRQLWVKGRRLRAYTVWADMIVNKMSTEEAADNWDLPVDAIREIVDYAERNRDLLGMEADEEMRRLQDAGVSLQNRKCAA